jgi:hypothetical protein
MNNKVFSEVYAVLEALGESFISKIPKDVFAKIKDERDETLVISIDDDKPLDAQNLSNNAMACLAFIKKDYWIEDEQEKTEFAQFLKENEARLNKEIASATNTREMLRMLSESKS